MSKLPLNGTQPMLQKVLAATRLHFPSGSEALPDSAKNNLRKYAVAARELGVPAAIAVSSHVDEIRAVLKEAAPEISIDIIYVPFWGAFVPALNALLGHAQQRGMKHILYHSLEVTCAPAVLDRLMDHFQTPGMLVVGPELDGHIYQDGEQALNGRTTPWNTLALWSVRKLAMTGFLSIADGLPAQENCMTGFDVESGQKPQMGSMDWWTCGAEEEEAVPAGVEEVTAIALLQRTLGVRQARAVLLRLPDELSQRVSWKTDWGQDVQRKQWHEYKMASKVARPAAQIKQLFKPFLRSSALSESSAESNSEASTADSSAHVGTVMHFGQSVAAPAWMEYSCLLAIFIFMANLTSASATALHGMGVSSLPMPLTWVVFLGLFFGGVFIPMPLSLRSIRWLTHRADHKAGLAWFAVWMLAGNCLVMCSHLLGWAQAEVAHLSILIAARLIEGVGSGVLFHARFALAASSTEDHHSTLQTKQFVVAQAGLGFGALLSMGASMLAGRHALPSHTHELMSSIVLVFLSIVCLFAVLVAFPRCLHPLPKNTGSPDAAKMTHEAKKGESDGFDETKLLKKLWEILGGTSLK